MDLRKCFICGEEAVIWDLEKYAGGFRHRNSECPTTTATLKTEKKRKATHDEAAADAVDATTGPFVRSASPSRLVRAFRWLARNLFALKPNGR